MGLPPPPGYYQDQGDGRMVHHPGFGETAQNYPGLPGLRILVIATAVLVAIVGVLLYFPRGPSPDEWATQLARTVVVDGTHYLNEPGFEEARTRVLAAISAWQKDSGCRLAGASGMRADGRAEVRAELDRALAEARVGLPEVDFGVGSAIADRGSESASGFGAALIVADCTKEQQAPMRGPFG